MRVNETQQQDDTKKPIDTKSGVNTVVTPPITVCVKQLETLDAKTLWDKRIEQLAEERGECTVEAYQAFKDGFFAGLSEAKKMFELAQFSKKTRRVIREGKKWRFAS